MLTVPSELNRLLTGLVVFVFLALGYSAAAQESVPVAAETAVEPSPEEGAAVRSQRTLGDLDRLAAALAEHGNLDTENQQLSELRIQVGELVPEGLSMDDLRQNQSLFNDALVRARVLSEQAEAIINGLTGDAEALELWIGEVRQIKVVWNSIRTETQDLPEALDERAGIILDRAAELDAAGTTKLNDVIGLQNSALAVTSTLTPIAAQLKDYRDSRQVLLFETNTTPIWEITSDHITSSSTRSSRSFLASLNSDVRNLIGTNGSDMAGHLLLLPVMLLLMLKLKKSARQPSAALARPLATGVLIWLLVGVVLYSEAPMTVKTVYVMVAMVVATVVLLAFLSQKIRGGVLVFVVMALIERLVSSLPALDHLPRVLYLVFGLVLITLGYFSRRSNSVSGLAEWGPPPALIVGASWATMVIAAGGLLAGVFGYVHLAKLLIGGLSDSIAVFLILFAGLATINEIIAVVLGLSALEKVHSINRNRVGIRRVLHRLLVWVALFLWIWVTAFAFGIDDWVYDAIRAVILAEISIGEVTLSLRGVVVFVLAVWAAVWASRIVRGVLSQDVLPRMDLPRGVPNTISMTAHYSIVMLGLLLGIGFMGIDLSSLAFIVGALGVGIGFGLQNLVNNFVSGLILIFEAPIQVGDTVEVGTLMGRVVQIGIRTSRVRTYSGSEVIVPNGDLVSNQVVNWTLSDRRRRLELTVGVAYGTDPAEVTALLRETVESDEDVLTDPEPIIVFNDFGDSALNFRVMAWIADFDQGFEMRHRLNTAINNALKGAGVQIPFPQRDLHVKTLPPGLDLETT